VRILFVCAGNICRSPTAEGVMRRLVADAGLEGAVEIESAGTGGWHAGEAADARATAAAARRGITLAGVARQVTQEDLERFDLVLAMDRANVLELRAVAPGTRALATVRLLRAFDPASAGGEDLDVPDPYYGGARGFDTELDLVTAACRGLLGELRARQSA
jgi:protein-tyrosine phosphatase